MLLQKYGASKPILVPARAFSNSSKKRKVHAKTPSFVDSFEQFAVKNDDRSQNSHENPVKTGKIVTPDVSFISSSSDFEAQ